MGINCYLIENSTDISHVSLKYLFKPNHPKNQNYGTISTCFNFIAVLRSVYLNSFTKKQNLEKNIFKN